MGAVFTIMLFFILIVAIVSLICAIIKYIFDGLGLMEMAKAKNEKYPWISWIPYAKEYLLGKLAYNSNVGGTAYLCITIGVSIISFIVSFIVGFVGEYCEDLTLALVIPYIFIMLLSIAYSVFYYITIYKLYKQFSDKAVIMIVFTILTGGILSSIFIFAIRKNKLQRDSVNIPNNI